MYIWIHDLRWGECRYSNNAPLTLRSLFSTDDDVSAWKNTLKTWKMKWLLSIAYELDIIMILLLKNKFRSIDGSTMKKATQLNTFLDIVGELNISVACQIPEHCLEHQCYQKLKIIFGQNHTERICSRCHFPTKIRIEISPQASTCYWNWSLKCQHYRKRRKQRRNCKCASMKSRPNLLNVSVQVHVDTPNKSHW